MKPFPIEYSKTAPYKRCHIYAGHLISAIKLHQATFFRPDTQNCPESRDFALDFTWRTKKYSLMVFYFRNKLLLYSRIKVVLGVLGESTFFLMQSGSTDFLVIFVIISRVVILSDKFFEK